MPDEHDERAKLTRHLTDLDAADPMPSRETSPLDALVPWVIEFRVVGTHHVIKFPAKEVMVIGRRDERHGVYPDLDLTEFAAQALGVSRKHAIIEVKHNRVSLTDLGSPNGTYINAHVLTPKQEYRLRNGDQVKFGRLQLQVHFVVKPTTEDITQEVNAISDVNIPEIGSGQQVLVVDEDKHVATLVETVLLHAGFDVVVAHDVTGAVQAIDNAVPSALIVELLLEDGDGANIIRHLREKSADRKPRVPVIVISTATAGLQMGQALREGISIFLGKPFSIEELVDGMQKIMVDIG